jgi:hypothetical protein
LCPPRSPKKKEGQEAKTKEEEENGPAANLIGGFRADTTSAVQAAPQDTHKHLRGQVP